MDMTLCRSTGGTTFVIYEHTNERSLVCSWYGLSMEKFVRKIVKNGRGSYYVNLPIDLVRDMKLRERQKLTLVRKGKQIVIEDWKK
jgi:hypothetical protein